MMIDCSKCIECEDIYSDDSMTPDAFGDSHVMMCDNCLFNIKQHGSDRYLLVETENYCGTTFVHYSELNDLREDLDGEIKIVRKLKPNSTIK